uniref:Uncharacterized protein n=1 Tax=Cannabis sativa TaxID=3483 RepID=A0A803NHX3_CANSA
MEVVKAAKMGRCISFIDVIVSLAPCASTIQTLTTLCLLGKIVTPKLVEEAAVKEFVRSVWKRPTSVTIFLDVTTKSTMYKFGFKKEEDMRWVLENGSWCSIVKVDLDEKKPASWSQWLRVRIDHDVEKPLYSGYFINLSNGTKKWIQYKYVDCFSSKMSVANHGVSRLGPQSSSPAQAPAIMEICHSGAAANGKA